MKCILVLLLSLIIVSGCAQQPIVQKTETSIMKLSSPAFENNGNIPAKYTCDGENISPPLKIEGIPSSAKSLVLIMDDPDAVPVAGKVWDHWVVWNIKVDTKTIAENSVPAGSIIGKNTRGVLGYGGPCPPDREHRYFFKLYALDAQLDLKEGATKAEVEKAMEGHTISKAELLGRYSR